VTRLTMRTKHYDMPHMECFFDEITEMLTIRCPNSDNFVSVEAVRRADSRHSPFVDVVYCEGCGNVIEDVEEHLNRINRIYYHH
jgi:Ni2+-binding GTPase involved in maturation of urease and hydrogenase